jgi:hypothetical protein
MGQWYFGAAADGEPDADCAGASRGPPEEGPQPDMTITARNSPRREVIVFMVVDGFPGFNRVFTAENRVRKRGQG